MIQQQENLFDLCEDGQRFKTKTSNDWKWSFKDYPKEKNGLKVFSWFACGGGSTMGYKLAGCDVIGCNEIDKRMNEVYIKNHNPKYNYLMDIRDFNKQNDLPKELYNLDIADFSPPCTTFSSAGEREKNWGVSKKFKEGQKEQILDDLSFVSIETVAKLRPKVVIMENVKGLLMGEAWSYVQRIYKEFYDIGYKVKHWLLEGEKMGVPQTRHRVFFIATRLNFDLNSIDMGFNYKPITYGEIKEGEGDKMADTTKSMILLKDVRNGEKDLSAASGRLFNKPNNFFQSYVIYDKNVMPTIRAATPDFYVFDTKRRISKEDVIHSQTFPEDYNFINDSIGNITYICGMSVPPIMIKRIVGRLIESGIFKGD